MNHFAKSSARAVVGIVATCAFLATTSLTTADSSGEATSANAPTPKRGGTLRLALPADISSMDPALAFDTISAPFLLLVYQGLVQYDDGMKVVPCLAENWSLSTDQRTYTFHLRNGVRFSNGREVEASDFVYSLERNLVPKTASLTETFFEGIVGARDFEAGKAGHVAGIRAPSPDTLVIELAKPDPSFLFILTLPGAYVLPREAVERYGASFASHPVGTGPYRLTEWRRGIEMRFERNPVFSEPGQQYLDAIEVMEGGDVSLYLMMFERGELDIADITEDPGIPIPDYIRIRSSPRWRNLIESMPAAFTWFLAMNTEMKPFDDPKVRQAMNYAIDKNRIVQMLHDTVIPAQGVLPPPIPGFNPNLSGFPHNQAKARELLKDSGHADGFTCKLWYDTTNPLLGPAASAIEYDLAQVGIQAQLNPVTLPALIDSDGRRKTVQCAISGWSQDYPDPSDFLDTLFNGNRITDEGCQNISFYNNPQVNTLLAEGATCKDTERRIQIYQTAEQAIVTDGPIVPLFYQRVFALHQPWVHGARLHPVWYFRFERMWLDR